MGRLIIPDNQKKMKNLMQDLQISRNKVNNLEDTLTALATDHNQTLKDLSNVNTNAKFVENIVFRMQTRESHMVVLIKSLHKARKKLEHHLFERKKELHHHDNRNTNLMHLLEWLKIVVTQTNNQLDESKIQL